MMIACAESNDNAIKKIPRDIPFRHRSIGDDLFRESPSSSSTSKNVVVVMDALAEFSTEALVWALSNVIKTGDVVTLLGVMPWLNLPLSCKTWSDIWTIDVELISAMREKNEWKIDSKYQKIRAIHDLCENYGVVPHMKVVMGYPERLLVLEQTTMHHATWVVFDRHHRKHRLFYKERIPCNLVMMNNKGEADMLKTVRPMLDNGEGLTPGASPAVVLPKPMLLIADELKEFLRAKY